MSEQAFRETGCGCVECSSAARYREIIKEKDAQIASLKVAIANIFTALEGLRLPDDPTKVTEAEKAIFDNM